MVDKDIALEKFSGTNAREWALWLEDYRIFGTLKKWNEEKLISNLRFFVTGDIKDCVRQKCGDKPKDLEELEAEVTRFLGGTLDPISAVHELDAITYHGSVERAMLRISELIPLAYPTLQTKADRQQMVLLHLQKLLPLAYQKELIKTGITKLEEAVTVITGMERADRSVQGASACVVGRVVEDTAKNVPQTDRQCFVCGLATHMKVQCPFKADICGKCERRGHLSTMCRQKGNGRRPAPRGNRQANHNHLQHQNPFATHMQQQQPQAQQHVQQLQWSQPPPGHPVLHS